jgi:uncharacterized UBP type Zn finger protein
VKETTEKITKLVKMKEGKKERKWERERTRCSHISTNQ